MDSYELAKAANYNLVYAIEQVQDKWNDGEELNESDIAILLEGAKRFIKNLD